jgi:peroxiredoxin
MEGRPFSSRLNDLEERFAELEPQIPAGAEKDAVSVLHGMIGELWRNLRTGMVEPATGLTLQDVADLYKTAPKMDGEAENQPLPVGTPAPDFTLPDANGQLVSLSDYRGQPVVLVFYPLDWSPTCSDQLSLYQSDMEEFARHGARLVGISVDSLYSHGAWAAVRGLTFPLLADFHPKGEVSRRYRVWREKEGFSERALYVVDGDGIIRYGHVSPRLGEIPDIYRLYEVLAQLSGQAAPESAAVVG